MRQDGWRWDGERWVIDSPDRRWVWDGQVWRPVLAPAGAHAVGQPRVGWRPALAVVLIGLLVVLAVVGGGGWLAFTRLRPGASSVRHPSPLPSTSASAAGTQDVAGFIPVAEKFVEDHRGLKFKEKVDIQFVTDAEFRQRLLDALKQDEPNVVKEGKLLRALALVPPETDLLKTERSLLSSSVIGYYDPETKKLVVRGAEATPATRHVLVHELTHALQDQHFSLGKAPAGQAGDEAGEAFLGLVEGDAVRIEQQYISSLSAEEQRQVQASSAGSGPPADVPRVLLEILAFPYQVGPPFTQALLAAKGQPGLDGAFTNRPTTTAQLLTPQKYLSGVAAASVPAPAPPAGSPETDKGQLGELGLVLMLEKPILDGKLSQADARLAGQAWAGDQYVAWDQGGQSCVRASFVGDGAAGNAALLKALQAYVADRSGAQLQGVGPITMTACA